MISGAPYFRLVPKFNIAGVAQANQSAIKTVINELQRANIAGPIIWINLREEPLVYINNAAHIVRERNDPLKPMIIPNVTGRVIESMEAKLKEEVLQEASDNGGNISVYV
uniref:Paladin n=1 Tax=Lygus hesperus TaxID=30085 RepID=A0A0A9XQL6_LYGHE